MTKRGCRAAATIAAGVVLLLGGGAHADLAGLCGWCFNSATVGDGIVFDELNVKGLARDGGPKILNGGDVIMADGKHAQLSVNRHFLSAVSGDKTYAYDELEGMRFTIGMRDGRSYEIKLVAVKGCLHKKDANHGCQRKADENQCTPLRFWASPYEEIPQYDFLVRKASTRTRPALAPAADPALKYPTTRRPLMNKEGKLEWKKEEVVLQGDDRPEEKDFNEKEHLCKGEFTEQDELWTKLENSAIAFEGDHYDRAKKTVSNTKRADGWFNLACYGAAVSKMHLLRHTRAGGFTLDGTRRTTTLSERTAMLKAITADYCGDGTSGTGDGTPLQWTDARGWFPNPKLDLTDLMNKGLIEAVWGPKGALCLNEPRRLSKFPGRVYNQNACTAPALTRDEVRTECKRLKRSYLTGPPAAGTSPATTNDIPKCDAAWVAYWPAAKTSRGAVHVVTANMTKGGDNYCKMPLPAP